VAWTAPRTWVAGEVPTAAILNAHIRDNLAAIGDPWTEYTPTWAASSTNPSLGNGTLSGHYIKAGRLVVFRVRLLFGSTTTAGNGTYTFTLPTAASTPGHDAMGHGMARDDSAVAMMPVFGRALGSTFDMFTGAGAVVTHAAPYTWATNDRISITGIYEAAA
jgi:hypothetical protein